MIGLVIKSFIPFGGFSDGPIIPVICRLSLDLIHERIFVMLVDEHEKVFVGVSNRILQSLECGTGTMADFLKDRLRSVTNSLLRQESSEDLNNAARGVFPQPTFLSKNMYWKRGEIKNPSCYFSF